MTHSSCPSINRFCRPHLLPRRNRIDYRGGNLRYIRDLRRNFRRLHCERRKKPGGRLCLKPPPNNCPSVSRTFRRTLRKRLRQFKHRVLGFF